LARLGARVVAIDAAAENVAAARAHADTADLEIDYRHTTAEALAAEGQAFDAVVAMEVVEHVADLPAFLAAAAALVRPGGAAFFATINRTAKSFAEAIVAAEYLLRLLPRGTHRWDRFVKPSELRRHLSAAGVTLDELVGVGYRPLSGEWRLIDDPRVNYMAFGKKG
jgi:2-polyprenyl-6-hydroxyphenyl methylase/3-demethylubiquinone-9 3-methyltransferase